MSLGKLFDDFYVVPDYQREYIWEEQEVEQLLDDVHAEFQAPQRIEESEYFIGGSRKERRGCLDAAIRSCAAGGALRDRVDRSDSPGR
jgi:hypothetical protein